MLTDFEKTLEALACMEFPNDNARTGWTFDPEALLDAKKFLNISYDISFGFITGKRRLGTHYTRLVNGRNYHRILLDQNRPIDETNETLWHELTHAMQSEAWSIKTGRPFYYFYSTAYRQAKGEWGRSYENNKFEIHAGRVANRNKHKMLII